VIWALTAPFKPAYFANVSKDARFSWDML
jgi:hypothetical protein